MVPYYLMSSLYLGSTIVLFFFFFGKVALISSLAYFFLSAPEDPELHHPCTLPLISFQYYHFFPLWCHWPERVETSLFICISCSEKLSKAISWVSEELGGIILRYWVSWLSGSGPHLATSAQSCPLIKPDNPWRTWAHSDWINWSWQGQHESSYFHLQNREKDMTALIS